MLVVSETKLKIEERLKLLDKWYNDEKNTESAILFAKLACMEYCGWIEETLDDILKDNIFDRLSEGKYSKHFEEKIIGRTYGFQYDRDIVEKMLIPALGIIKVQNIEISLNAGGQIDILRNELCQMREPRNVAAHTYTKSNQRFDAPSIYLAHLNKITPILEQIHKEIKNAI